MRIPSVFDKLDEEFCHFLVMVLVGLLVMDTANAAGTFSDTGRLNIAREDHTATLLPNGKVLVAGGYNGSESLSSAELYDPDTETWVSTDTLNSRLNHTATLLQNGKVLVTGGTRILAISLQPVCLSSAELYDPDTETWSYAPSLTHERAEHTATLLPNAKVLVTGGYCSSEILSSAELYDPNTGRWASTGPLNIARRSHAATLLQSGKVLVAGAGLVSQSIAELYDPDTGTWTTTRSLGFFENAKVTLLQNGYVLIVGGRVANLYNPVAGLWAATGCLARSHGSGTATLLPDGKVLVAGRVRVAELYSSSVFCAWAETKGLTLGMNARVDDNPDGDAMTNLDEFAYGGDPLTWERHKVVPRMFDHPEDGTKHGGLAIPTRSGAIFSKVAAEFVATVDGIIYRVALSEGLSSFVSHNLVEEGHNVHTPRSLPEGYQYHNFRCKKNHKEQRQGFFLYNVVEE